MFHCIPVGHCHFLKPATTMTFSALTAASVAEFAVKPFIRLALANPAKPQSVLSFFLGIDMDKPDAPDALRQGHYLNDMMPFWFGGHADYDTLCAPFGPVVRDAGAGALTTPEWTATVNGQVAQLILCDQLSRNCFRGQDEAFQYDRIGTGIARALSEAYCCVKDDPVSENSSPWEGEFYPPMTSFCSTALMHSESLEDHELALQVIDWAKDASLPHLKQWWEIQYGIGMDHKMVIERFGRYPHRNRKLGRTTTEEEAEWLKDPPAWAKSQQ